MLRESLEFLLTPTSPIARKYGFLYSSISLKHRYERCKKIWIPHLKQCQDLFLEITKKLPQKKHVVILGSAHLHEIPMHLLMQNFEQITLVDIIHPLKHHWMSKKNSRLKLITQDLTLALEDLEEIQSIEDLQNLLEKLSSKELFHFKADLIISANILSQLALLPIDALEKKLKRELTVDEKDLICSQFANIHLANLKKCQGKKLIYSDREVIYKDQQNEVLYRGHYPVNFQDYNCLEDWQWSWTLAPLGEASKDYSIEMSIKAYLTS